MESAKPERGHWIKHKQFRLMVAAAAILLSLPAACAVFFGVYLAVVMARLGAAYNGSAAGLLIKVFRASLNTPANALASVSIVCLVLYWPCFIAMVVQFARGLSLPSWPKGYCLTIVVLAIFEELRLELLQENTFWWFGSLSAIHVLVLIALVLLSQQTAGMRLLAGSRRSL